MIPTLLAFPTQTVNIEQFLQDPNLKGAVTGVYIGRPDGSTIFESNADIRLMPASNEKILSVYFALASLGPDYRPTTKFWKNGNKVYVEAEGDPLLSAEQLADARKTLKLEPNTNIFVKQSFAPNIGPGWEHDDLPHAYAAPITAFTIDAGRFVVRAKNGQPLVPNYAMVATQFQPSKDTLSIGYNQQTGQLSIKGAFPKNSENVERFALKNPAVSAALALGGSYRTTNSVPETRPDFVVAGRPIRELAKLCLEPSDNMIAEHLMFLATQKSSPSLNPSFTVAGNALTSFANNLPGILPDTIVARDGSGLSRHNLVTARSMAQVLRHIYQSNLRDIFLEALPKPGEGTMSNRLKDQPVFAKTGTLSGACSLSGYVMKNGEPVIFSIIMNHHVKPSGEIRKIQDKIVSELCSNL